MMRTQTLKIVPELNEPFWYKTTLMPQRYRNKYEQSKPLNLSKKRQSWTKKFGRKYYIITYRYFFVKRKE